MIEIQLAKEEDLKQLAYIEEVCFPVKEAATLAQFQKDSKLSQNVFWLQ